MKEGKGSKVTLLSYHDSACPQQQTHSSDNDINVFMGQTLVMKSLLKVTPLYTVALGSKFPTDKLLGDTFTLSPAGNSGLSKLSLQQNVNMDFR
jgi:hypothetical protein